MALESTTNVNGLVSTNPTAGDAKSQGDDHLRLIKSVLKTTFPNLAGAMWRLSDVAAPYSFAATDNWGFLRLTTDVALSIVPATVGANWCCLVFPTTAGSTLNGSPLGLSDLTLVVSDGVGFFMLESGGNRLKQDFATYSAASALASTDVVMLQSGATAVPEKATLGDLQTFFAASGGLVADFSTLAPAPALVDTDLVVVNATGQSGPRYATLADIWTYVLSKDGPGSTINADLLDGLSSAAFLQGANDLADVADVSTARTNLGLGSAAVKNTGTSGDTVPTLLGANTWDAKQTVDDDLDVTGNAKVTGYVSIKDQLLQGERADLSLVPDPTKWYRVLTFPTTNATQFVEAIVGSSANHFLFHVRAGKGTGESTLEVTRLGQFASSSADYFRPQAFRLVDGGVNQPSHVDVQFDRTPGAARSCYVLVTSSATAAAVSTRPGPVAFTDQGTASAGKQVVFPASTSEVFGHRGVINSQFSPSMLYADSAYASNLALTPEMFGAKGDCVLAVGSVTGTDDLLAFQRLRDAALASTAPTVRIRLGAKNYRLSQHLIFELSSPLKTVVIEGEAASSGENDGGSTNEWTGGSRLVFCNDTPSNILYGLALRGPASNTALTGAVASRFELRNFGILARTTANVPASVASNGCLYLGLADRQSVFAPSNLHSLVENIHVEGANRPLQVINSRGVLFSNVVAQAFGTTETIAAVIRRDTISDSFTGDIRFDHCTFSGDPLSAGEAVVLVLDNATMAGAQNGTRGIRFTDSTFYYGKTGLLLQSNFNGTRVADVWAVSCQFDGYNVNLSSSEATDSQVGIELAAVGATSEILGVHVVAPYIVNYRNGVQLNSTGVIRRVDISGGEIGQCGNAGIGLQSGKFISITGVHFHRCGEENPAANSVIPVLGAVANFTIQGNTHMRNGASNTAVYMVNLAAGATGFTIHGNVGEVSGACVNDASGAGAGAKSIVGNLTV